MTPIEKARKLMNMLENEEYLTTEELLYLYCLHFIYVKIGYRLPHTFLASFYHEQSIIEIKERIDEKNNNPALYNQFKNEAAALQYIILYEMDSSTTA
jgi:uncharacterized coiled-coil DUF342 family protein